MKPPSKSPGFGSKSLMQAADVNGHASRDRCGNVVTSRAHQVSARGNDMRRRELIGLLGGAAGAWACADTFAAVKSPKARVGYLDVNAPPTECCVTPECRSVKWDCQAFCQACWLASDLRALGWREGENLQIEIRSGNGHLANLTRAAAELVALRPDILVAVASTEAK